MHPRRLSLVLVALLALAVPAGSHSRVTAQQQEPAVPTFRSDVGLVLHAVAVLDTSGRPVTDLTAADFVVYEDAEPQQVELFLTPRDTALDVALLLDSSTSLLPWTSVVRRAAKTFLFQLAPEDCVYLLPFNDRVGPGTWGRGVDPAVSRRVEGLFMQGSTALYDAVREALIAVDAAQRTPHEPSPAGGCGVPAEASPGWPSRRRAVVLLTDGADETSASRFDQVLEDARAAAIPIFPVVVGEARRDERLRAVLDRLAGSTGGTVIESVAADSLPAAYEDVVSLLRASYLLGYRADDSGEPRWRDVSVRSRRPSYRLVHRERYHR